MIEQDVLQKIVWEIKKFDPDKIILFGSQNSSRYNPESDIDLLVVKDIAEKDVRGLRIEIKKTLWKNLKDIAPDFDIIVDSEKRILQRIKMGDLFYKEIYTKGKTIYAE